MFVKIRTSSTGLLSMLLAKGSTRVALRRARVDLCFPEDFERHPLRVVLEAGESNERQITAIAWLDILHQVLARANGGDVAGLRRDVGKHV
jgi:hypothetical protein